MQAYKLEATISNNGTIELPRFLRNWFNRTVEIIVLEKKTKVKELNGLVMPAYKCGGKVSDFNREELYNSPRL